MDDDRFEHMLKMSVVYIGVLQSRSIFEDFKNWSNADEHNALNCLEIVADTFVEMQRRLGVKPKYKLKLSPTPCTEGES